MVFRRFSVAALLRRWFDRLFIRRLNRSLSRRDPEAFSRIQGVVDRYRSGGALAHTLQVYKLWELERILDQFRPARILEFGTGSTTPVFAAHVLSQRGATLLAVDEDPRWLEHSRGLLPPAAAESSAIRLEHRTKVVWNNGRFREIRYEPAVAGEFDLVFIDGPSLQGDDGRKIPGSVNTNVADLLSGSPPRLVVVDMRADTVRWFAETYGDLYRATISDRVRGVRRRDYRYLTIFELVED
jgi:hypothetical protein